MEIKDKTPNDPIASLYLVDAYMRWALLAAEEVVGKQGLQKTKITEYRIRTIRAVRTARTTGAVHMNS